MISNDSQALYYAFGNNNTNVNEFHILALNANVFADSDSYLAPLWDISISLPSPEIWSFNSFLTSKGVEFFLISGR